MIDLYTDLGNRVIANDLLTAKLMSEMSKNSPDPEAYMMRLTSEVAGLADRLASANRDIENEHYDPSQITQYLYRLCDMAEGLKTHGMDSSSRLAP